MPTHKSSNTICLHLRGPDVTCSWPCLQAREWQGSPCHLGFWLPTCVAVPSSEVRETLTPPWKDLWIIRS